MKNLVENPETDPSDLVIGPLWWSATQQYSTTGELVGIRVFFPFSLFLFFLYFPLVDVMRLMLQLYSRFFSPVSSTLLKINFNSVTQLTELKVKKEAKHV